MAKYLFDANIFVQAKEREYRFEFAGEFWDWMIDAHLGGVAFSTRKVLDEINAGPDDCPARAWAATAPNSFFIPDTADADVMKHYSSLMKWAATHAQYSSKAKADFADPKDADAFLIAAGKHHGMIVCTHEVSAPQCRRKIPLPDAASALGVPTIGIFDVLSAHATSPFKFKP